MPLLKGSLKKAIICLDCGRTFYVRAYREYTAKYCSKKCHLRSGSIEMACDVCGKLYRRPKSHMNYITKTCSLKCRGIITRTEQPSIKDIPAVKGWLKRRNMISQCEKCGYNDVVEILIVHHKDRSRINNSLDNLVILCPNCHAIEHYFENKHGWKHKSTKRKKIIGGYHAPQEREVTENYIN